MGPEAGPQEHNQAPGLSPYRGPGGAKRPDPASMELGEPAGEREAARRVHQQRL